LKISGEWWQARRRVTKILCTFSPWLSFRLLISWFLAYLTTLSIAQVNEESKGRIGSTWIGAVVTLLPGIFLGGLAGTTEDLNKVFGCDLWSYVCNNLEGGSHVLFGYFNTILGCGILTELLPITNELFRSFCIKILNQWTNDSYVRKWRVTWSIRAGNRQEDSRRWTNMFGWLKVYQLSRNVFTSYLTPLESWIYIDIAARWSGSRLVLDWRLDLLTIYMS
jgi:hypothetical protein